MGPREEAPSPEAQGRCATPTLVGSGAHRRAAAIAAERSYPGPIVAGNTKGIGFVNVKRFVTSRPDGQEQWGQVMEQLTPADREIISSALASAWYPVDTYARLVHLVADVLAHGDARVFHELGRFEAESDLTIVHRVFMSIVSPATVLDKVIDYWRRFHDTGTWELTRPGPNSYRSVLRGWAIVDEALCWEMSAYMARLVELTGAEDVRVRHPECRARGAPACVFEGRWR